MSKVFCTSRDCLLRTCSKHRCNAPQTFIGTITWIDLTTNCTLWKDGYGKL